MSCQCFYMPQVHGSPRFQAVYAGKCRSWGGPEQLHGYLALKWVFLGLNGYPSKKNKSECSTILKASILNIILTIILKVINQQKMGKGWIHIHSAGQVYCPVQQDGVEWAYPSHGINFIVFGWIGPFQWQKGSCQSTGNDNQGMFLSPEDCPVISASDVCKLHFPLS